MTRQRMQGRRMGEVRTLADRAERLLAQGDAPAALIAAQQAVTLRPDDPHAQAQRGQSLMRLGRPTEAAAAFAAALRAQPDMALLHLLLGNAYRAAGDHAAALSACQRAVALAPGMEGAWRNLGLAFLALDRPGDAAAALRHACALDAGSGGAWNALGAAVHAQGAVPQAICAFSEAARVATPDGVEALRARWNLSQLRLLTGDMAAGWPLHEYRRSGRLGGGPPPFGLPFIDGRPQPGTRVLVTVEQGLGDIVMVLRFLPLLAAEGVRVFLQRPAALRRLLQDFPGVEGFMDDGMPPPPVDGVLPCMSLPALFVADRTQVLGTVPYLRPDPDLAARWEGRLAGVPGLRVGFVWAGNPDYTRDRDRSPGLAALMPLMRMPGLTPVCLQVGPGRRALEDRALPAHAVDLGGTVADMVDTVAILSRLDLLVSCCTLPVHLAGAIGLPAHVLLSAVPDWRWGLGRPDSAWYPSVRLHRQDRPGDWSGPLESVTRDLSMRIGTGKSRQTA